MQHPLVIPHKTVDDLFPAEKKASAISRLADDHKKWAPMIHSELMRWVPYLAEHDVEIVLDHIEPEAGAALGYVQVRNRTRARPQDNAPRAGNIIRIPIVVQDRKLEKFLVFEAGGQVYPLSEERVSQAMLNPSPFDTDVRRVPRASSLVDQLYPPYQQRQGFGRIVEPGAAGLSKLSSAPSEKTEETEKAASLRAFLSKEAALPDLCLGHFRSLLAHLLAQYHLFYQGHWLAAGTGFYSDHQLFERLYGNVRAEIDQLVERAVGMWGEEVVHNPGDLHQVVAHLLGEWSVLPVLEGACESEHQFQGKIKALYECLDENGKLTLGLEDLLSAMASKHEEHCYLLERRKGGIEKSAMVRLDFSLGRAMPGSMVLDKIKNMPEFMPGTVISSNYYFFPVQGTSMYMGVKKDQAKKLDKLKDQNAKREALMELAYKEMHTTRTGRKSSGHLILVTKTKDGFRYETPAFAMGGGAAAPPARGSARQTMSKKAGTATKTDPGKWDAAKAEAKRKMGGKHSARAMQLATQIYKKKGGGYSGPKPDASSNSLKKWTKQKWGWTGGKKDKGIYLPKEKAERLKGSKEGRKALEQAAKKKREATEAGKQYSSHGLAAGTSFPSKKEAEVVYRGKTFPGYNQPVKSDREGKKKMVLAKKDGKVKLIHYGHSGYKHNYSKSAKKNYLTRSAGIRNKSGELTANDKHSANYWARRDLWPSGKADGSSASEKRGSEASGERMSKHAASLPATVNIRKVPFASLRSPQMRRKLLYGAAGLAGLGATAGGAHLAHKARKKEKETGLASPGLRAAGGALIGGGLGLAGGAAAARALDKKVLRPVIAGGSRNARSTVAVARTLMEEGMSKAEAAKRVKELMPRNVAAAQRGLFVKKNRKALLAGAAGSLGLYAAAMGGRLGHLQASEQNRVTKDYARALRVRERQQTGKEASLRKKSRAVAPTVQLARSPHFSRTEKAQNWAEYGRERAEDKKPGYLPAAATGTLIGASLGASRALPLAAVTRNPRILAIPVAAGAGIGAGVGAGLAGLNRLDIDAWKKAKEKGEKALLRRGRAEWGFQSRHHPKKKVGKIRKRMDSARLARAEKYNRYLRENENK